MELLLHRGHALSKRDLLAGLGCFELVVGEARARSLVESPSRRFSVVALKRCRQHRSRLGLLLAQRLPGLGEVPAR